MTEPSRLLRLVLDTNVVVAALRSGSGASSAVLTELARGSFVAVVTPALLFEYEAVLSRAHQGAALGARATDSTRALDDLAGRLVQIIPHFSWRPQLADAADEMVLEAAVNGRAKAIVTFNTKHLAPAVRFGIDVWTPAILLRNLRDGTR